MIAIINLDLFVNIVRQTVKYLCCHPVDQLGEVSEVLRELFTEIKKHQPNLKNNLNFTSI